MSRFRHLLVALTLVAAGAGCELIVKIDPSLLPGAGGGGGSGGAGSVTGTGGTSSATGTGGTIGTGGTTGTGGKTTSSGTGGGCATAADCPPATKECTTASCDPTAHTCSIVDTAAGSPAAAGDQIQGDCKQVVCDGSGNAMAVNDDTDVPDDGEVCTDDSCSAGAPVHAPNTATCAENNGKVCGLPSGPKAGKCVACNVDADCTGNGVCQLSQCVTSACNDQVQDGTESDVDCGGTCAPCPDHDQCKVDGDCQSNNCSPSKTCTPASCTDELLNEGETDTDCGGPVCGAEGKLCGTGKTCAKAADCQSDNCDTTVAHACKAPTCIDGILNEGETDTDCGGPSCGGCPNGRKCVGDGDCISQGCSISSLTCVPQCTDGRKDGVETDIDCGGTDTCPRCALMLGCALDTDCTSNACDAVSNTCIANQCLDHRLDGVETDTDCGGGTCGTCALGRMCKANSDCATQGCSVSSLTCVPQCTDGSTDGVETDIDCGGGTCPTCAAGQACKIDGDCASVACQTTMLVCVTPCTDGHVDGAETDIDCGGGTCPTCAINQGCLVDTDCISQACDNVTGKCSTNQCNDQHVDGSETDVDCGGGTCPTCATGQLCMIDGDCATNACDNMTGKCVASQCVDQHVDGAETDVDCGGGTCPACGVGQGCGVDSDCTTGACDTTTHKCVASQCGDQHVDGAETDVDCGGGTCPTCALGQMCSVDTDCISQACDGVSHLCVLDPCGDHRKDGAETDVDCGGGTCAACAVGLTCHVDTDCMSQACDGLTLQCVASQCADDRVDGAETDVDCGGGTCPTCTVGEMCTVDTDCASSVCDFVSGTCVASECVDGRTDGAETDVDCGGGTCPACATGLHCNANTDCTSAACDTTTHLCVATQCTDEHVDGAETDVDCGGGTCPACALGEGCLADGDCATSACDTTMHQCVAGQCADEHVDGAETDVDCGGGTCPTCALGQMCLVDTDCISQACDGVSHLCVLDPCGDHRKDGAETDMDCGGGTCAGCVVGLQCNANTDCISTACDTTMHLCVATQCTDEHVDGAETDVDCGGGTCPACAPGLACLNNTDCASNVCLGTNRCM